MNLLELAERNPSSFADYSIEQIVAICGDGKLRDGSLSSDQLRGFLSIIDPDTLERYANYCLDNKFERSGFVLQDCVNEIGKRLGYEVKNGRYSGVQNEAGFDGLWFDGSNYLIVEVKTTDAYRINLDTVCGYRDKLAAGDLKDHSSFQTLIVVGRQDTGDLEAQVRGSKHAWTVRLISVDALLKLMFVRHELNDPALLDKVRRILMPFEYTRVDNIVDLVFETQQETEGKAVAEAEIADNSDSGQTIDTEITSSQAELRSKRNLIAKSFFAAKGVDYLPVSQTKFSSANDRIRINCAVSKRYKRDYQPYWYALHPSWLDYLKGAPTSFFVLGCMDLKTAYALPLDFVESILPKLNQTIKGDKAYWHIALNLEDKSLKLNLSKVGEKIDLSPFSFNLE